MEMLNPNSCMDIDTFSGGINGIPPGACGLLAAAGSFSLNALLKSAMCLQYRGRTGAGVTLKGLYKDNNFYVFHIMFRDQYKVKELEKVIESWGVHILESQDLVVRKFYYEYDLPVIKRYFVTPPTVDEMMYRERINDHYTYIVKHVTKFNKDFMNDARIFSSSRENGTFLTAFELIDTIKIYGLEKYEDKFYDACLIHLRWPTSRGRGLWWGPQPISLGEIAGIHNGHLSSDKSNAIALEQLGIHLHVGTDSEAIFLESGYLLNKGFTIEEIEWIISGKFPQEIQFLSTEKRKRYNELINDPILKRMKMSGPATAIVLVNNILLGFTDRDHLRSFSFGCNDKVVLMGSEQRAILSAAYFMGEELDTVFDPEAGKIVAYEINNKKINKLDYEWSLYASK